MRVAASLAALGTLCATPILAQNPSSSSDILPRTDSKADLEGAIEIRRLAACAARRNPEYARSMLGSLPGSHVEERIGDVIGKVVENCMALMYPVIRFSYASERGALAEAMYLGRHPAGVDPALAAHPARPVPATWLTGKLTPFQYSEVVAHDFAQCVVAGDPGSVDALIRTVARSAQEKSLLMRLRPGLGPCMMQGRTYHFDAEALRSYLAQALYRDDLPSATAVAATSTGEH